MAHQLDFHITLWSDDESFLLALERQLQFLMHITDDKARAAHFEFIAKLLTDKSAQKLECHSIDINWDDEPDTGDLMTDSVLYHLTNRFSGYAEVDNGTDSQIK